MAVDDSSSLRRTIRLVRRGTLPPAVLVQMAFAEWRRADASVDVALRVRSNRDLLDIARANTIGRVYLFRAGLIVSRSVLDSGLDVLNVHCARVPEFGGIGSIARALAAEAFDQLATLHRVTERIDEGEVLRTRPYRLDPAAPYWKNEDAAYAAGVALLLETLACDVTPHDREVAT
jgi:hypothetical protein